MYITFVENIINLIFNMENTYNFYRIKMSYKGEDATGAIASIKTEDLVMATCYSEAEKLVYALMEGVKTYGEVSYEILKNKNISNILFNNTFNVDNHEICGLVNYYFEEAKETETGLYAVTADVYTVNEKTGKTTSAKETVYMPATSPNHAIKICSEYLEGIFGDFIIRHVKYDNAQSVFVTPSAHSANLLSVK